MSPIFIGMEPLMGASDEIWKQRWPRFSPSVEKAGEDLQQGCREGLKTGANTCFL